MGSGRVDDVGVAAADEVVDVVGDGAALADNVTRFQKGVLTGAYFSNVATAVPNPTDPLAVDVTMKTPWPSFPQVLLIGQIDYIASPTWMAAADADETLKSKPVGTGPFMYVDYKPNEFFKAAKLAYGSFNFGDGRP